MVVSNIEKTNNKKLKKNIHNNKALEYQQKIKQRINFLVTEKYEAQIKLNKLKVQINKLNV
jgi:hypothetical protein